MSEDKQHICNLLLETLQATRTCSELAELEYDSGAETVTAVFEGGGTHVINVACDSGSAMIYDIMKKLWY